ncbi:MAG TPA: aspartate kinase [Polyangia bacterium]|jgi:aspartokinase/homoserine dehydrogenase 1
MSQKRPTPEIHKFGGASLADVAAFRHAIDIVHKRMGPRVVVCSAPSGITDVLLGMAKRARSGQEVGLAADSIALRRRYQTILQAIVPTKAARRNVADEIDRSIDELDSLVTSLLVLKELTPRTSDFIAARGERLSALLFAAGLEAAGEKARYVDAVDVVITDGPYGGASPNLMLTDMSARKVLRPLLDRGMLPVVPGFLGAVPANDDDDPGLVRPAATLGRGGTDLTATLLGRALGAREVMLWKDVPGMLTADPRVVPNARIIPQLHVREAAELAYFGAKVLHPRALIPVSGRNIPVFVRPFADPSAIGTEISGRRTLDRYPVKALSSMPGQALITVAGSGMLGVPGIAARTFAALFDEGISVSLISQSSSEQSICLSVPESAAKPAQKRLAEEFRDEIAREEIDGVEVKTGLSTLAVVGIGMAGHPGIAGRVFRAMSDADVNIVAIAQGSSELNISFVVASSSSAVAQRAIHDTFQLAKIGGGAATTSDEVDVVLLGFGQIGRTLAEMITKGGGRDGRGPAARKGVRGVRIVGVIDRSGFLFDPDGLSARDVSALVALKETGRGFADAPSGRVARAADAIATLAKHALSRPVLVDVTADETTALIKEALGSGMNVVLANKRPLSGSRDSHAELHALAAKAGQRILFEATVGAGLPILDTYKKLAESGDRVLRIDGCVSGTLGFLMTEIGRGRPFSEALRKAMEKGFTEPDPRDDLSGADVGRKALILGRLLGFEGEPAEVEVESLVPEAYRKLPLPTFLAKLDELDHPWAVRVAAAKAKGGTLRYVASVTKNRIIVGLKTVDGTSPFAGLKGTDNQIAFTTNRYKENPLVVTGPGAGLAVTAAGVLNDILGLAG